MDVSLFELWQRNRQTVKEAIPTLLGVLGVLILIYDFGTTQTLQNATPKYGATSLSQNDLRALKILSSEITPSFPSIHEDLPKELVKLRPKIFSDTPRNFSLKFKNPCYFDKEEKLHCLPYFFIIGAPKCGTTDLWFKIMYHPHIDYIQKEPHWWTRYSTRKDNDTLNAYEDLFFNQVIMNLISGKADTSTAITGDGSASTLWQNFRWEDFYPEHVKTGPPYIIADVIRYVLPQAKLIISLREPVARLYSEYSAFKPKTKKSPEDFHAKVVIKLSQFSSCLTKRSLRSCAYRKHQESTVRLTVGLYSLFISDWLQRYPRDQMMLLTLEEWQKRCPKILPKIFSFLAVDKVSPTAILSYCSRQKRNVNKVDNQPMLNSTRRLLRDFYRPYVEELAHLLNHKKFLWDYAIDQEKDVHI